MHDLSLASRRGGKTRVEGARLEAFRAGMRGETLLPGRAGLRRGPRVWNAMIDRRPGARRALRGRRRRAAGASSSRASTGCSLAVRGGGHNIAGNAVCDGGLVIDLSRMRAVRVDPARRTARVEPGATLADLDQETQAFGLATPLGINSTTGVAGLTLGGGFGWLTPQARADRDNLLVRRRRDGRRRAPPRERDARAGPVLGGSGAAAATSAS